MRTIFKLAFQSSKREQLMIGWAKRTLEKRKNCREADQERFHFCRIFKAKYYYKVHKNVQEGDTTLVSLSTITFQ